MNLYLFIDPKNDSLSDQEIWNQGKYAAAVWEWSPDSAVQFAELFYNEYNQAWIVRQITDPTKLSTNEDDSRWYSEWDY